MPHADTTHPDSAESLFVEQQFLALTRSQWRLSILGVLGVAGVLMVIAHEHAPLTFWIGWLAAIVGVQLFRMHVLLRRPEGTTAAEIRATLRLHTVFAVLSSSVQALVLVLFDDLGETDRALVTLLLLGLVTGNISNGAGKRQTFVPYCLPLLIPLSLLWMLTPSDEYSRGAGLGVGLLLLVCSLGVLMGLAKRAWHLFDESCRIRFRESALNARLVEALAAAEQANRAKTRFLAAASHDLRQPLHVISLVGASLKLRPLDDTTRGMVNMLNQVSGSLSSLLETLLDISKLDAGVVEPQEQSISMAQVVQQLHTEVSPLAHAKGLSATLENRSQSHVRTDPVLLLRVLHNLTQNALKFTQQGGLTLRTYDDDRHVVIEVQDTGRGIAPENQDEVFQEFFQVGNQERDPTNGLGLGLSIVRRIAQLLHIELALSSQLGVGTTITLRLVADRALAPTLSAHPPHTSEHEELQFNLRVLVIDDEVAVRKASELLLTELGCDCRVADDLADARLQIEGWQPEVIISDLRLRGALNGIETLQALRGQLGPVPALLISGDTAPERLAMAKRAGIRLCHKPLNLTKLVQELRAITHTPAPPG